MTVDDIEAVTQRFAADGGTLLDGPNDRTGPKAKAGNRGRSAAPWALLVEFESFPRRLLTTPRHMSNPAAIGAVRKW